MFKCRANLPYELIYFRALFAVFYAHFEKNQYRNLDELLKHIADVAEVDSRSKRPSLQWEYCQ
jgi:hypothetical protein